MYETMVFRQVSMSDIAGFRSSSSAVWIFTLAVTSWSCTSRPVSLESIESSDAIILSSLLLIVVSVVIWPVHAQLHLAPACSGCVDSCSEGCRFWRRLLALFLLAAFDELGDSVESDMLKLWPDDEKCTNSCMSTAKLDKFWGAIRRDVHCSLNHHLHLGQYLCQNEWFRNAYHWVRRSSFIKVQTHWCEVRGGLRSQCSLLHTSQESKCKVEWCSHYLVFVKYDPQQLILPQQFAWSMNQACEALKFVLYNKPMKMVSYLFFNSCPIQTDWHQVSGRTRDIANDASTRNTSTRHWQYLRSREVIPLAHQSGHSVGFLQVSGLLRSAAQGPLCCIMWV